jgi:hypothetical protein
MTQNDTIIDSTEFFALLCQTFERAVESTEVTIERFYRIGGHSVRLRFATESLVPLLTPALAHLEIAPLKSELTIYIWEDDMVGLDKLPPLPWSREDYTPQGEILDHSDAAIKTAFHSDTLSMLNTKSNLAIYWVRDAKQLTYVESGSPLLRLFHWWMRGHGKQLVHAGAVGTPEGGALLVGKGGSGKSTTCLLCLSSGLSYVADDYCLVSANQTPYVHSLYCSGKVSAQDIGRLPSLEAALSNRSRLPAEKALYFLDQHSEVSNGFPLRAVLVPRVSGLSETMVRKVSPSVSLMALAPSTIFQLPGAGEQAFKTLGKVVKQVPSYLLEIGTNLSSIPRTISNLLSEL